jgi:phosphoribosylformimino-5-aminoimidazole carboxamide ribotide isomerase
MFVIPAIDLLDGNVVRLKKGDYTQVTVYERDPVALARRFADAGYRHIHIVDLNGARDGVFFHLQTIRRMMDETGLSVQVGGGIRTSSQMDELFDAGISNVVSGSMAVNDPETWLRMLDSHGSKCIFGMDLKDGKAAVGGWLETSDASLESLLEPMIAHGLKTVLCTDIQRDGMLSGANHDLYAELMLAWPQLQFIASGGVAGAEDLKRLKDRGVYGVVVGRAYFEGALDLATMSQFHS